MGERAEPRGATGCRAKRLLFDDEKRCIGAEYIGEDLFHAIQVGARREVILSCGSIDDPKLLMLSGIGPAEHLREFGIDVVVDSPGVGENLEDHPEGLVHVGGEDSRW